jgi:hypothetical protein
MRVEGDRRRRTDPSDDANAALAEGLAALELVIVMRWVTYEMMEAAWPEPAQTGVMPDWMEPWMEPFGIDR